MNPSIFHTSVYHTRTEPVKHAFKYNIYNLGFDVSSWNQLQSYCFILGIDKPGLWSLKSRDYLTDTTETLSEKVKYWLKQNGETETPDSVYLITMPRFGPFGFNPVNYYLCSKQDDPVAWLIVEINNTFGEKHLYVLGKNIRKESEGAMSWDCPKEFHVSPFNRVEGDYQITLKLEPVLKISVEVFKNGNSFFSASMVCKPINLNHWNSLRTLAQMPFTGLLTTTRIGWQAALLYLKKNCLFTTNQNPFHTGL